MTNNIIPTAKIIETEKNTKPEIITNKTSKNGNIGNIIIPGEEDDTQVIDKKKCNDRCTLCSDSIDECLKCKNDFDLYEGGCIPYAFYAIYNITRYYEEIEIFNNKRLYDIYAIKIENEMFEPSIKFTFPDRKHYTVYYYLIENLPISLSYMFSQNRKIIDFSFNKKYINNFFITDMKYMFSSCKLKRLTIDFSNINIKYLKEIDHLFYLSSSLIDINLSNLNVNNVTNMSYMFYYCKELKSVNFNNFNTQNVVNMSYMFYYCQKLESLDLSNFNTEKVKHMQYMFFSCTKLESLAISNFNTKNVIDMSSMFYECESLTSLKKSIFNSENIVYICSMFYRCHSLTSLDLSAMITKNVVSFDSCFYNCRLLSSLEISNFNTENAISMSSMFAGCQSLTSLNLQNFNVQKVLYTNSMFYNCNSLTSLDLSNFRIQEDVFALSMFYYCKSLKYLDISGLILKNRYSLFFDFPKNCTIKINKRSDTKIDSYPSDCNIIWVD